MFTYKGTTFILLLTIWVFLVSEFVPGSTIYAATLAVEDDVTIGAGVQERSEDLLVTLVSTTPGTTFNENQTINYQITYGSETYSTEQLTIEATWSLGTVDGGGSTVNILNYVSGSASNAYGSTAPVIDLTNRKITWTINAFPGRTTDQTVTFSLRTNSNYQGSENVSFTVLGRTSTSNVVSTDSIISQNYIFSGAISPDSDDGDDPNDKHDGPSSTSGTPSTSTEGSVPTLLSPTLKSIDISYISATEATIKAYVSGATQVKISYGSSPTNLNSSLTSFVNSGLSEIDLKNLKPNTTYYFKLYVIGSDGQVLTTEIYTFKTAEISLTPTIDKTNLVVTSRKSFLYVYSPSELTSKSDIVVIPVGAPYEFRFKLSPTISIKDISIILRDSFNTDYIQVSDIAKVGINEYVGRITTTSKIGLYQMFVRVNDQHGNRVEDKLIDIKIVKPFGIYDKSAVTPLSDVLVTLYIYNPETGTFELIKNQTIIELNPIKSDSTGIVPISLPSGVYKAKITRLGYQDQEVTFTIGAGDNDGYPTIYMQKVGLNLSSLLSYYGGSTSDVLGSFWVFIGNLSRSDKFYNFVSMLLGLSTFISFLAFISYLNSIPLRLLPIFILDKIKHLIFGMGNRLSIAGKVLDFVTHDPVAYAQVYVIDASVNNIIHHLTTDAFGHFYFSRDAHIEKYKLNVAKAGFELSPMYEFEKNAFDMNNNPLILYIKKRDYSFNFRESFSYLLANLFTMSYEFLLILLLLCSLLFIKNMSAYTGYIFLLVSIINLISWLYCVKKRRSKRY